jgi:hypothetical protein
MVNKGRVNKTLAGDSGVTITATSATIRFSAIPAKSYSSAKSNWKPKCVRKKLAMVVEPALVYLFGFTIMSVFDASYGIADL